MGQHENVNFTKGQYIDLPNWSLMTKLSPNNRGQQNNFIMLIEGHKFDNNIPAPNWLRGNMSIFFRNVYTCMPPFAFKLLNVKQTINLQKQSCQWVLHCDKEKTTTISFGCTVLSLKVFKQSIYM